MITRHNHSKRCLKTSLRWLSHLKMCMKHIELGNTREMGAGNESKHLFQNLLCQKTWVGLAMGNKKIYEDGVRSVWKHL